MQSKERSVHLLDFDDKSNAHRNVHVKFEQKPNDRIYVGMQATSEKIEIETNRGSLLELHSALSAILFPSTTDTEATEPPSTLDSAERGSSKKKVGSKEHASKADVEKLMAGIFRLAVRMEIPSHEIATMFDVSPGRVSQLAPRRQRVKRGPRVPDLPAHPPKAD